MAEDNPLHIRLLNLLSAIRDMSPFNVMSAEEEELLRGLIVRWHVGEPPAVSDIMRELVGVSQTTAYRRLIALRDKGLVDLRVDQRDKRVKFVEPTALARNYAQRINRGLESLVQQAGDA